MDFNNNIMNSYNKIYFKIQIVKNIVHKNY